MQGYCICISALKYCCFKCKIRIVYSPLSTDMVINVFTFSVGKMYPTDVLQYYFGKSEGLSLKNGKRIIFNVLKVSKYRK